WQDTASLTRIRASQDSFGTLERPQGELRWAKVEIGPSAGGEPGAFVVAFHPERERDVADKTFWMLLALSGVALLMTTGIGWAVAGRILAPVR
ncbi:two-component sensor histidine kinase, partial [Streptomyces sp. SID7982]|nr:two-component sensor histidine kinase [Streptomyces sp. SID7982]